MNRTVFITQTFTFSFGVSPKILINGGVGHNLPKGQRRVDVVLPARSDLREVLGGREDFPLGETHILLAACDYENWLLAPHRRLDVCVCLGS